MEDNKEKKKQEDEASTPQAAAPKVQEEDPTIVTPDAGEPIPSSGSAKNSK